MFAVPPRPNRFFGVAIGVVTNIKDPDALGRVKLALPWLAPDLETDWARVAMPMAGAGFGTWFVPDVNSEVLVAFEHGSLEAPFVLGVLWNGKDKPPETMDSRGANDVRTVRSRSGHVVRLVDSQGGEKIEIIDKAQKNSIVIDTAKNSVTISAASDIVLRSTGGKVTISGKAGVEVVSDSELKLTARAKSELSASGPLVLKGGVVNIN
jgi:uncharacterized protein involved in type VI secretion and phage assembly